MKIFRIPDALSDSLIATLMEAGFDIYQQGGEYIVVHPDAELPTQYMLAQKLQKPTNIMGKWAMSLAAKKLKI